jgi:hypothetical protein
VGELETRAEMVAGLDAVAVAAKRRSELDETPGELEPSQRVAEQLDCFAQHRDAVCPRRHGARHPGERIWRCAARDQVIHLQRDRSESGRREEMIVRRSAARDPVSRCGALPWPPRRSRRWQRSSPRRVPRR